MISVRGLTFSYGREKVVDHVSFDVQRGQCLMILGNNGAGKSTLITALNRVLTPQAGQVLVDGLDVLRLSRRQTAQSVAYVAQKNEMSHMTVFDCVLLGRKPWMAWGATDEDLRLCDDMLGRMGMQAFRMRYMNELSGGELQKIMLARALVQQPRLLLLDEPTSNLDPKNQHEMLHLVRVLAREKHFAVVTVIHDLALALRYGDTFLLMHEGRVYAAGGIEVITPEALYDVYGIHVRLPVIDGHVVPVVV